MRDEGTEERWRCGSTVSLSLALGGVGGHYINNCAIEISIIEKPYLLHFVARKA
jgi:hypothetical protein